MALVCASGEEKKTGLMQHMKEGEKFTSIFSSTTTTQDAQYLSSYRFHYLFLVNQMFQIINRHFNIKNINKKLFFILKGKKAFHLSFIIRHPRYCFPQQHLHSRNPKEFLDQNIQSLTYSGYASGSPLKTSKGKHPGAILPRNPNHLTTSFYAEKKWL